MHENEVQVVKKRQLKHMHRHTTVIQKQLKCYQFIL